MEHADFCLILASSEPDLVKASLLIQLVSSLKFELVDSERFSEPASSTNFNDDFSTLPNEFVSRISKTV